MGKLISEKYGLVRSEMNKRFRPITGKVTDINEEFKHNNDLKIFHDLCMLTQAGPNARQELLDAFKKSPGVVHQARWVTAASNLLCLYLQSMNPSKDLILVVKIILNIYGPALFYIKENWHVSNGPLHVYNVLQLSKKLLQVERPDLFTLVKNVIQNNGFYLHPENMLLAMVHDQDGPVRRKAIKIIESLREHEEEELDEEDLLDALVANDLGIRRFDIPTNINFEAKSYTQLINFKDFELFQMCSPPILKEYSIDDIKARNFTQDFKKVPAHSQHVERFVSLTSEAGKHAVGQENRHFWILNKMEATSKIPTTATKGDFLAIQDQEQEFHVKREKVKKKLCFDENE